MLEWAAAGDGPTLALLVDHDDAEREFATTSTAETIAEPEPITDVAARARLDRRQHGPGLGGRVRAVGLRRLRSRLR